MQLTGKQARPARSQTAAVAERPVLGIRQWELPLYAV